MAVRSTVLLALVLGASAFRPVLGQTPPAPGAAPAAASPALPPDHPPIVPASAHYRGASAVGRRI